MNTSAKGNLSRSMRGKRKKAIPLRYQRSHASLQDLLQLASYQRKIKVLLKTNKELAVSLQDAKYRAARQQNKIEEFSRTNIQIGHARMKLRDMVSSIRQLVTDVDDVATILDVGTFNVLKNSESDNVRLKIAYPETSTIEESICASTLEENLTGNSSTGGDERVGTPVGKNNCSVEATEIYDLQTSIAKVDSVLSGCLSKSKEAPSEDSSASISLPLSPVPQPHLFRKKQPGKLEAFLQSYKESPRKPLQPLNKLTLGKTVSNPFISKIPKVLSAQPVNNTLDENVPPPQVPSKTTNRRETFVIEKPNASDRRGTFVINPAEDKSNMNRRETYLVAPEPALPIPKEVLKSEEEFVIPILPSSNEFPNKTILMCEDMELTGVIPIQKLSEGHEKSKEPVPPPFAEDMEFTEVIPFVQLPQENKISDDPLPDKCMLPDVPPVKKSLEDRNQISASKTPPLGVSSMPLEQKRISGDNEISSSSKKSQSDAVEHVKEAKSRTSSMSKRKSLAHKKSARLSEAKSKAIQRKSMAKTSLKKPLTPKPLVTYVASDDSMSSYTSPSPPSSKRKTRNNTVTKYNKYFEDDSFTSADRAEENLVPGRKVLNFFETRKSLLPNKRTFVFTNPGKKVASESAVPTGATGEKACEAKIEDDVFRFSASGSENGSPTSNKKRKKKRTTTKKSSTAAPKKVLNKPDIEKAHKHLSQKKSDSEIRKEEAKQSLEMLHSEPETNQPDSKTRSSETSDDSFVIGSKMNAKKLVNLKGGQIFFESSKDVRKTPSRHCKKSSPVDPRSKVSSSPENDSPTSDVPDSKSGNSDSETRDVSCPSSRRSSKVSGGKGRAKRTFSGISERRSKKKSTLESPDIVEELAFSQELIPITSKDKAEVFSLDLANTEVYNFKDKVQKRNLDNPKQSLREKQAHQDDDLTKKSEAQQSVKGMHSGAEASPESLNELTEVYNLKDIIGTRIQKRNLEDPKHTSREKHARQEKNLTGNSELQRHSKDAPAPSGAEASPESLNELTEVYNLKDIIRIQKRNLEDPERTSREKHARQEKNLTGNSEHQRHLKDAPAPSGAEANLSEVTQVNNLKDIGKKDKKEIPEKVSKEKQVQIEKNLLKHSNPPQIVITKESQSDCKMNLSGDRTEVYNLKDLVGTKATKRDQEISKKVRKDARQEDKLKKLEVNLPSATLAETISTNVKQPECAEQSSKKHQVKKHLAKESELLPTTKVKDKNKELETLTVSSNTKSVKDADKMNSLVRKHEDGLKKTTLARTEPHSSHQSKSKKTLKEFNRELLHENKNIRHAEPKANQGAQENIPMDVLSNGTSSLSNNTHEITSKDKNKHIEIPHKNLVSTQNIKTKMPLEAEIALPSSSNVKEASPVFNKEDLKNIQLDDLLSNDFVPSKSTKKDATKKKDYPEKVDVQMGKSKSNKPRPQQSEAEILKTKLDPPVSIEVNRDSKQGDDAQAVAVAPPVVNARRRNGSGSIDSLYNADSKDQLPKRPSRSTRTTKSLKEPTLNIKLRREK